MKRFALSALFGLALARAALGTDPSYINYGTVDSPVEIDAVDFVNFGFFGFPTANPFDFSSTINFTNRNTMVNLSGYKFEAAPVSAGVPRRAANFVNASAIPPGNNASITAGYYLYASATNIVQRGLMRVSEFGLLRLQGSDVDVSRGTFVVGDPNNPNFGDQDQVTGGSTSGDVGSVGSIVTPFGVLQVLLPGTVAASLQRSVTEGRTRVIQQGIYDRYWGFGSNTLTLRPPAAAAFSATNVFLPGHDVVTFTGGAAEGNINGDYATNRISLAFANPGVTSAQMVVPDASGSNKTVQAVILFNANTNIKTSIRFFGVADGLTMLTPSVEWSTVSSNVFGLPVTNTLYLTDGYGARPTNTLITNFFNSIINPPYVIPIPPFTYQPTNFTISRGMPVDFLIGTPGPVFNPTSLTLVPTNPPAAPIVVSNSYAAYAVDLTTTTVDPFVSAGDPNRPFEELVRALPGRVEITGEKVLNLNLMRLQGLNYVLFKGTNHFIGSSNAAVSTAFADIYLASTNGSLVITNLLQPLVRRISGTLDMYSAHWFNSVTNLPAGNTNVVLVPYNVLVVDSDFDHQAPSQVLDFDLRCRTLSSSGTVIASGSNSVTISDTFHIRSSFSVDADRLTISTNKVLDFLTPNIDWMRGVPSLRALTNNGTIASAYNLYFFGRQGRPYGDIVNQGIGTNGVISASGVVFSSTNFQNSGIVSTYNGATAITTVSNTTLLPGGALLAPESDILITAGTLNVTNHAIRAGHAIWLSVSDALNSGTNQWSVNDGFNLLIKPTVGDLRHTTVTNTAFQYADVVNWWAGEDRGATPAGWTNNGVVGRMILNGGNFSRFTFNPIGDTNAIYVDRLVLLGSAAGKDAFGNLTGISIAPNMTIYSAGVSGIGTILTNVLYGVDGTNGGRLVIDASHIGIFSSIVVTSPSGGKSLANAQAVEAAAAAAAGISEPANYVELTVTPTDNPNAVAVSWNTAANALNHIYYKDKLVDSQWKELTTVTSGPVAYRLSIIDPLGANGRFYKVQVDVPTP